MVNHAETIRLFGVTLGPDRDTNARHRAVLRKILEIHTLDYLRTLFGDGNLRKLRLDMGTNSRPTELGRIQVSEFNPRTGRYSTTKKTDTLDPDVLERIVKYIAVYDALYKRQGDEYIVRNKHVLLAMQAAEQAWHDLIVQYRAAHGLPSRPEWALEPLPGLARVTSQVRTPAPRLPHTPPATAPRARRTANTDPALARTAPPALRRAAPRLDRTPPTRIPVKRSFGEIIDISSDEDEQLPPPPKKKKRTSRAAIEGDVIDLTV
ncbi:hypothetical protein C8F04DRAFT_1202668 [Mycena alexandri]|uniref:Uncharacterized protein n=1 Tax=Mycena alexandri TaxID=1745969 RepID=A0AAD6WK45_9AGAR|nr:hypothetical protein C8F04DRAFT_1202668 [Mycena alexandri]